MSNIEKLKPLLEEYGWHPDVADDWDSLMSFCESSVGVGEPLELRCWVRKYARFGRAWAVSIHGADMVYLSNRKRAAVNIGYGGSPTDALAACVLQYLSRADVRKKREREQQTKRR